MIFLGLGSNLQSDFGDRCENIDLAIGASKGNIRLYYCKIYDRR